LWIAFAGYFFDHLSVIVFAVGFADGTCEYDDAVMNRSVNPVEDVVSRIHPNCMSDFFCELRDACFTRSLFFDLAKDLKPDDVEMTPWAAAIQAQRESRDHVDDPYGYCLPPGSATDRLLGRRIQGASHAWGDGVLVRDVSVSRHDGLQKVCLRG